MAGVTEQSRITVYTEDSEAVCALLRVQFIPQRVPGFTAFLRRYRGVDHRLGDLAADVDSDPTWPKTATRFRTFYEHIDRNNWGDNSLTTLAIAWCQFAINEVGDDWEMPSMKAVIPADVRWQVWERDNFTCQECGTRQHLSVDHILAESKGGTMDLSNLRTLCKPCNSRKGAR